MSHFCWGCNTRPVVSINLQEYSNVRDAETVRGRAAALAAGEEEYNPSVDKPEVLKLFNNNLKKQKDEYKRQVAELTNQLSAARSQVEAAEQKAARRREKMETVMAAHLAAKADRARQQQVEQEMRAELEHRCSAAEAKVLALSGQIATRSNDRRDASPAPIALNEQDQWARALAAEEESDTSGVFSIPESPEQQRRAQLESTQVIDEEWPVQRRQKRPRFGDKMRPVNNTKKISWSTRQGRGTKGITSRYSSSKAIMLSRSGPRIDSFFQRR